ncbi:MAG TPA: carotenoid biosynthesis protein [Blastocatellia bacterium]|nr:carotenoid biosynthesis protein [Blastocatellia bacterium]HMV82449.1 carotenoid biosynthesis protein [Blastocatellia bacterium]HMY73407.1 carotenoid biosynthesis protein [Blastocatellia bacterium]HMZ20142.1 carotenoid biosynthesis protein [Blastocatellia bacterium]HNG31132.1 carotenoid biosynthesis protein [Blastocatellia bacterium]
MKLKLERRSLPLAALILAYAVMWLGGVGHYVLVGRPPLDAPWAASLFLLLAGVIVVVTSGRRELLMLVVAAVLGFLAEVLGVRYGFIFSPYHYTSVLQPQLLSVPLVMLSAWMVLVAYVRQMFFALNLPVWLEALSAAAWMTAIDLVIDPLAANQLGYWRWQQSGAYYGIPLHNFLGWFAVSLLIFSVLRRRVEKNAVARCVGLSIVLFFSAIALSYGLWLAGGVGIFLALADVAWLRLMKTTASRAQTVQA